MPLLFRETVRVVGRVLEHVDDDTIPGHAARLKDQLAERMDVRPRRLAQSPQPAPPAYHSASEHARRKGRVSKTP
eukprot:scaffold294380_cov30-Tisochrysis_lutea.AAC.2